MENPIEQLAHQERDRVAYREVIDTARQVFEHSDFTFSESTDVTTDNPTLLFNISGGVRYERVLSGEEAPPSHTSIASIQRCIRADGLHKVGYTGRHHIAFDMLGHFNFFDYDELGAKRAAIMPAYQLLQKLNTQDLFARCHPDDTISKGILTGLGVVILEDVENTHVCNNKRRSGDRVEFGRLVNGNPTELWNLVFTLYEGVDDSRVPLRKVAFDSGASVDRLVSAANGKAVDYEAAHWRGVIERIDDQVPYEVACRAADFAKAASVLVRSGVTPGPKKQQYIARKVFKELVRLDRANPSLGVEGVLRDITTTQDTGADIEKLLSVYKEERYRLERSLRLGEKAIRAMLLSRVDGSLGEEDYAYLKSTHGLDEETINNLISTNQQ